MQNLIQYTFTPLW